MEVAESSSTLEDSLERKQTEDVYARQGPVSVVNADNGVRRFVANTLVNADNGVRRVRRSSSRPIVIIDGWNKSSFKRFEEALRTGQTEHPVLGLRGKQMDRYKNRTILGGWEYREKYPDYIPVSVEKDPRSDIPDIDMKKYRVHSEMPLGELVYHIRLLNGQTDEKPWFAFFKNTQPPTGALMGQIDEENKEEDGFLLMTYSGEEDFDDTYVWVDKEDFFHEQQQ